MSSYTHSQAHTQTQMSAPGILPKSNIRKQESFPMVQRWGEKTSSTVIHPNRSMHEKEEEMCGGSWVIPEHHLQMSELPLLFSFILIIRETT